MIRFPDIQALIVGWLTEQLAAHNTDATVSTTIPPGQWETGTPLVQVILTGGVQASAVVDGAQITLDVWADSAEQAAAFAGLVRALIPTIRVIDGIQFYQHAEVGRPVPLLDPRSDQERYRQTHTLRYRALRG